MKIIFLPDISLHNTSQNNSSYKKLNLFLNYLNKKFKPSNFIVNLEGVLLKKKIKPIDDKVLNLSSNESVFKVLKDNNIKNICLSNNHIFDFGYIGLKKTINFLKKKNINYFGSGRNIAQASRPLLFKDKKMKCAIFGMSYKPVATKKKPGVFNLKDPKSLKIIRDFKKINKSTFIIVYCHSGLELFDFPLKEDEKTYKKLISNGADIVIGSHPHRVQGIEKYKGKFILYSIGDLFYENVKKKDWKRYISKPAHAFYYKSKLKKNIILNSYLSEIDLSKSMINIYEIQRSKKFNYSLKKIDPKKLNMMCQKYKKKLTNSNIKKYRILIENKVFKYAN